MICHPIVWCPPEMSGVSVAAGIRPVPVVDASVHDSTASVLLRRRCVGPVEVTRPPVDPDRSDRAAHYPDGMPNPARSRGRQVNAFQALALLLSFVLAAGVGGVLAAGLALPGVALANGATDVTAQAFDALPTELAQPGLPQKS